MGYLKPIDVAIVIAYLVGIAAIGLSIARRQKTTAQYFIANGRIPTWAVAFTLMATMISSVTFVAHPGAVFAKNMWGVSSLILVPFVLVFVAMVIVPFYRRVVGMSAYEYLEKRFGIGARIYGSFGFVALRMLDLGFTLYTTAIAASVMTGWNIGVVILGVGVFTLIYTMIGGIEGVIWTDVAQGFVLIGGALIMLGVILFRPEGGPAAVIATAYRGGKFGLGDASLHWSSVYNTSGVPPIWILVLLGAIGSARSYITEQNMVQRYLVARTDRGAKIGVFAGAFACVPIWITFMFIGAGLWAFYHMGHNSLPADVVARPDSVLPYFVATQLPAGLVGLILAAILAAAQSSISADLNSVSTVVTTDYFARFRPKSSDKSRLLVGRLVVLVGGLVSTGAALLLTNGRALAANEIAVTVTGIFAAGMLGLFSLGFLTRRCTKLGAYCGIASCVIFTAWATFTGPLKVDIGFNYTMHPAMLALWTQLVLFGVGYAVSVLIPDSKTKTNGLTIYDRHSVQVEDDS